jgi:hypothetical protein
LDNKIKWILEGGLRVGVGKGESQELVIAIQMINQTAEVVPATVKSKGKKSAESNGRAEHDEAENG